MVRPASEEAANDNWDPDKRYDRMAERLRAIGMDRLLFGTDWPEWQPSAYMSDLEKALPLTDDEFQTIRSNQAPWIP